MNQTSGNTATLSPSSVLRPPCTRHHASVTFHALSRPPLHPIVMEADDAHDLDSTFGGDRESLASSTTSLYSVVTRYEWQHGRRYHGYNAGKYHFPNDEIEQGRMHIEHDNQRLQMNGALYRAPIQDPQDIVDLGTGNGLWCIDMAEEHPNAQVLGIDLSPVQPEWVPPNCTFEVDDFDLEWFVMFLRFLPITLLTRL